MCGAWSSTQRRRPGLGQDGFVYVFTFVVMLMGRSHWLSMGWKVLLAIYLRYIKGGCWSTVS